MWIQAESLIPKTATPLYGNAAFSVSRSLALNPLPVGSPALYAHKWLQHTTTFGDPFLLDVHNGFDRLVRLGPFFDEELWTGEDDTGVHRGRSQVRRGRRMWAFRG